MLCIIMLICVGCESHVKDSFISRNIINIHKDNDKLPIILLVKFSTVSTISPSGNCEFVILEADCFFSQSNDHLHQHINVK